MNHSIQMNPIMIQHFNPRISFLLLLFIIITTIVNGQKVQLEKIEDMVIYKDTAFYSAFPSIVKSDDDFMLSFRRAPNRKVFGEPGNNHVDPNSYLVMMRSKDGISWAEDPSLLYAHPFGGSQDPCMVRLSDGTIICSSYGWAFVRPNGMPNLKQPYSENKDGVVFLGGYNLRSEDDGKTWQGPHYPPSLPVERRYDALGRPLPAYNRGAMCEGKDGRLFWVVAASMENAKTTSTHLLISEDKGLTWEYSCPVAVDDKVTFNETSIHETPSGDLVAFLRTGNFEDQACIARSTDGGKSFQPWEKMGFQGHPFHALKLKDDRVLVVYGYRHKPYGIRAKILNPECTDVSTAPEFIVRDDGGTTDLGYPWSTQLDDDRVLVVYYFNKDDATRHIAGSVLRITK